MGSEIVVMGIDPGTDIMGYGLVKMKGSKIELIRLDELLLKKYSNQQLKLKKIFERTLALIDEYHPDEIAIEAPFFGKNVQSMLKLGRAQGVAMAASLYREVPIVEYLPKKIKAAVTGNGNASKEQVAGMLKNLLKFSELPKNLDSTDGLAAAVCHCYNRGNLQQEKNYNSWENFAKQNINRIKGK